MRSQESQPLRFRRLTLGLLFKQGARIVTRCGVLLALVSILFGICLSLVGQTLEQVLLWPQRETLL